MPNFFLPSFCGQSDRPEYIRVWIVSSDVDDTIAFWCRKLAPASSAATKRVPTHTACEPGGVEKKAGKSCSSKGMVTTGCCFPQPRVSGHRQIRTLVRVSHMIQHTYTHTYTHTCTGTHTHMHTQRDRHRQRARKIERARERERERSRQREGAEKCECRSSNSNSSGNTGTWLQVVPCHCKSLGVFVPAQSQVYKRTCAPRASAAAMPRPSKMPPAPMTATGSVPQAWMGIVESEYTYGAFFRQDTHVDFLLSSLKKDNHLRNQTNTARVWSHGEVSGDTQQPCGILSDLFADRR